MMTDSALDTARLHSLDNLMAVIFDDEQHGSEVKYLARQSLPPDIIRQPLPDVTALAQVYGAEVSSLK